MGVVWKENFTLQIGIPEFPPVETCFLLQSQFLTHQFRMSAIK